ncbi:MAG: hypothetical protein QOK28_2310 [Actinomycetota bacterium]|jgi:glycosyltransferase involved in cell wall biosynthesis
MRIAFVVQPLERTPPLRSGAVERTVWYLAEGMLDRGHEVTLFASGDSVTRASLVPTAQRAILRDLDWDGQDSWFAATQAAEVLARQSEFDIVNSHASYSFLGPSLGLKTPSVTSWHGFVHRSSFSEIFGRYSALPLMATSNYQREATSELNLNWVATCHNGIAEADVEFSPEPGSYLLYLARVVPDKQPDVAIKVARAAGCQLVMAGSVFDSDYFDYKVRPLLRHPGVEYIGEVWGEEKRTLLRDARALVHPSLFEACSNVIIEALGSGTPVICLDRSSNSELVDQGFTGFVAGTVTEMVDACDKVGSISRIACREAFRERFTADAMVERYLAYFEEAAK